MSVESIVQQSHFYPVVTLTRYSDTIGKQLRYGPKGYRAFRYVVSSDIIDHQNEIVDIQGLAEVLPIMKKQGSRIQGLHSNYPAGEFFDWGFCKISDKMSIWVDLEIFDDYPSQKELLEKIQLPSGHPERMNGISLGGKSLEKKRLCDQNRCWTHITKIEGWELSIVKEGANGHARQIQEDTDTLEGLNLAVEYLNKLKQPLEEDLMTIHKRDSKGRFHKNEDENGSSDGSNDGSKTNDCPDCPECPECKGKMVNGKCENCGHSTGDKPEGNLESGNLDGVNPEGENPEGKNPVEDKESYHNNTEGGNSPEDKMNGEGYSQEDENMANENLLAIEQKIDTITEALNIGKEETATLRKTVDTLANAVVKLVGEQPPEEVIEREGHKYQLVKEDTEDKKEVSPKEETVLIEAMAELSKEVAIIKSQYSVETPIKTSIGGNNPQPDDAELLNKSDEINTEEFFKSASEEIVKNSGLDYDDVDFNQRQELAFDKQMSLDEMGIYING